jgi:hypothetical protein
LKNIIEFIPLGKENAISMDELATRTESDARAVRQLIYNARCTGDLICSTCEGPTGGYYIATSVNDAIPYLKMQDSRIKSACRAVAAVRKFVKNGGVSDE